MEVLIIAVSVSAAAGAVAAAGLAAGVDRAARPGAGGCCGAANEPTAARPAAIPVLTINENYSSLPNEMEENQQGDRENTDQTVNQNQTTYHIKNQGVWSSEGMIGRGAYGEVELITSKTESAKYAMKKVKYPIHGPRPMAEESEEVVLLKHEIEILSELKHERVVSYKGVGIFYDCLCMLMEYVALGSLKKKLEEKGAFTEEETLWYSHQVLEGLDYLHSREKPIIHGDLKCANILLGEDKCVKLCDFGTAGMLKRVSALSGSKASQMIGTFHFLSPEAVRAIKVPIGTASDIWSLGCTVVEMLTCNPPWWTETEVPAEMITLMLQKEEPTFELPRNISNCIIKSLREDCFQYEPSQRKDAHYLLQNFGKSDATESLYVATEDEILLEQN